MDGECTGKSRCGGIDGMSGAADQENIWTKKLTQQGIPVGVSCGRNAANRAGSRLAAGGSHGISGVDAWMGADSADVHERESELPGRRINAWMKS